MKDFPVDETKALAVRDVRGTWQHMDMLRMHYSANAPAPLLLLSLPLPQECDEYYRQFAEQEAARRAAEAALQQATGEPGLHTQVQASGILSNRQKRSADGMGHHPLAPAPPPDIV
jgi:hypothetical protein